MGKRGSHYSTFMAPPLGCKKNALSPNNGLLETVEMEN